MREKKSSTISTSTATNIHRPLHQLPRLSHTHTHTHTVRCISSRVSHTHTHTPSAASAPASLSHNSSPAIRRIPVNYRVPAFLNSLFIILRPLIRLHFSNSVINVLILAWIGVKWRKDEVYSVCWGGCDQSLEWIKACSSLRSKRSVITPLGIHSGFYIPAPCSLHLNVIRDYWGERNM